MNRIDIRWKQRFQNFEKSLYYLDEAVTITNPDMVRKAGLIQLFEISFELSWNIMKDYLEDQGFSDLRSPRDSIKKAFESQLIEDGHMWLQALKNRNLTSHTYDEVQADLVVAEIKSIYYPLLKKLYTKLKPQV